MSEQRFLELLQELLTMADPAVPNASAYARAVLKNLYILVYDSGKGSQTLLYGMKIALKQWQHLVECREDFAGIPGDYRRNAAKRHRLHHMIYPGC